MDGWQRHWPGPFAFDLGWDEIQRRFSDWHQFFQAGSPKLIKEGRWTRIFQWSASGFPPLVVKEYRLRFPVPPVILPLRHALNKRAKRAWSIACLLEESRIPVPQNVALVFPSCHTTLFVMAEVPGDSLKDRSSLGQDLALMEEIGGSLRRMHQIGVVHGDLKWPNLLLAPGKDCLKPVFIDFDGSSYRSRPSSEEMARDLARFIVSSIEFAKSLKGMRSFLHGYGQGSMPEPMLGLIYRYVERLLVRKGLGISWLRRLAQELDDHEY